MQHCIRKAKNFNLKLKCENNFSVSDCHKVNVLLSKLRLDVNI